MKKSSSLSLGIKSAKDAANLMISFVLAGAIQGTASLVTQETLKVVEWDEPMVGFVVEAVEKVKKEGGSLARKYEETIEYLAQVSEGPDLQKVYNRVKETALTFDEHRDEFLLVMVLLAFKQLLVTKFENISRVNSRFWSEEFDSSAFFHDVIEKCEAGDSDKEKTPSSIEEDKEESRGLFLFLDRVNQVIEKQNISGKNARVYSAETIYEGNDQRNLGE